MDLTCDSGLEYWNMSQFKKKKEKEKEEERKEEEQVEEEEKKKLMWIIQLIDKELVGLWHASQMEC